MTTDSSAQPWALIFDVDGVIANTEPAADESVREVFAAETGITLSPAEIERYLGSTAQAMFRDLSERRAINFDIDALCRAHTDAMILAIRNSTNLALPGAIALFQTACQTDACCVALATGSDRRRSEATIAACGVDPHSLRAWITGDDIERAKPDPEIYLKAAAGCGISPHRCVAIEDSPAGVASAKAAGLRCVAVTNTVSADRLCEADAVIDTLTGYELPWFYKQLDTARV